MSHEPVELIINGELTCKLYQDLEPESPDDWDDGGVFLVTTKNRYFQVIPSGFSVEGISEYMKTHKLYHNHVVFPLFAYVHSGVALSLGQGYPFNDPWDSGQIGYVLVRRNAVKKGAEEKLKAAESLVKTWNEYLSGDVYGYVIEDAEGNHLDSCWGFYGYDYAIEQAKEALAAVVQKEQEDSVSLTHECAL